MSKKTIEKIIEFCDNVESSINIDEAVAKDYSYEIGTWDTIQRIRDIVGYKKIIGNKKCN
jgi:hypothetical protein